MRDEGMIQGPTVGRIVFFGEPSGMHIIIRPAIVLGISDTNRARLSLWVFTESGGYHKVGIDYRPNSSGFWWWPPRSDDFKLHGPTPEARP